MDDQVVTKINYLRNDRIDHDTYRKISDLEDFLLEKYPEREPGIIRAITELYRALNI